MADFIILTCLASQKIDWRNSKRTSIMSIINLHMIERMICRRDWSCRVTSRYTGYGRYDRDDEFSDVFHGYRPSEI
jgi:hypothetical protein